MMVGCFIPIEVIIILNAIAFLTGIGITIAYSPMMYGCEPMHFSTKCLLGVYISALSAVNFLTFLSTGN